MESNNHHWQKPFFTIWTGQVFSLFGSSLVQFALIWWLTQQTGSGTVLAAASVAGLLPQILLGPFAGALVDRWNRRVVMIVSDGAAALVVVGLMLLFWMGIGQVWHVYIALFLRALGGAFQWPAMRASTSLMVPDRHLARVAGLNSALQGAMGIASPALGALLLSLLPLYGILAVEVVTALMAILPLLFINVPQPDRSKMRRLVGFKTVFEDVIEGVHYLRAWPGLLGVIVMAMVLNFFAYPTNTLLPLVVTRHFNGDAWHLGLLESMFGVGAIAGGILISLWGGFKKKIITALVGIVGTGVSTLIIAGTPGNLFWVAAGACLVGGIMGSVVNGPFQALFQSKVQPELQGRVMGLNMSLISVMMPLSVMIAGPMADHFGVMLWFWISGAAILIVGVAGFFIPVILTVEDTPDDQKAKESLAKNLTV